MTSTTMLTDVLPGSRTIPTIDHCAEGELNLPIQIDNLASLYLDY
jgi:hypothetical protein